MEEENTENLLPLGTGNVRVDIDLLRQWLLLPDVCEIVNAQMDMNSRAVRFTVKHINVPIVPDGVELPSFKPIFETKHDEDGIVWHRLQKIQVN